MLITNFASGELSPNLNGRVDIQQYYQGAARIENFDIIPTGGIKRRPGTQRLAQITDGSRIIPFIVDKTAVYVLELNENVINVWKESLSGTWAVIQTLATTFSSLAEINEIQYAQNYDTMYLVHRNYRPYKLYLNGTDTFEISAETFDFEPTIELDDDFGQVMVDYGSDMPRSTGDNTFEYQTYINGVLQPVPKEYAPGCTPYCTHKGKLYNYVNNSWQVYGTDPETDTALFTGENKRPGCVAFFNNRLFFASTVLKRQRIWASATPDAKNTRYRNFATYKKYVTVNKVVREADLHLFTCDVVKTNIDPVTHTTTLTGLSQNFTSGLKKLITDYYISGDVVPLGRKVVSVTSNTMVIDTDELDLQWAEGETEKTNLTMSIQLWRDPENPTADDYDYLIASNNVTTADCSLYFELASDENDAIMFLSSNKSLVAGTESSVWSIAPTITALNISATMEGRYGSDTLQAMAVETATIYFAQGRKGIREFYYNGERMAFQTNNIAILADHILRESKAVDFDYMTNPYSRLLVVRENGTVAEMLYDKTNGIMAWSRITMLKGKVQSCAVTRGDDENDLIFFSVKDGEDYYLELLDLGKEVYLDSYRLYSGASSLAGYNSGAVLYNATTDKSCDYDNIPAGFIGENDVVYVGYPFKSYIKSMPVVAGELSTRKRINALYVRFYDSYLPVVKVPSLADEKFTTIKNIPYSGVAKVTYPGITDRDVCFELEAADFKKVNILSVEAQLGQ